MFENNFLNNIINSFNSFKNTHSQQKNVNGANIALGLANGFDFYHGFVDERLTMNDKCCFSIWLISSKLRKTKLQSLVIRK